MLSSITTQPMRSSFNFSRVRIAHCVCVLVICGFPSAAMSKNRLADESSLYLKQHAENPVNWYPWGEEAWAAAREQDKPVIVSVGYSACHWCHVMEHESFEDEYIAGLMNEHFICIKVDREERPDVDQIYMDAIQMINGHGGWPLNAFCLPDGRPFFGGTYFPPEDRGQGIIPWPQLLMRISDHYKRSRGELEENADNIIKNMAHSNTPMGATGEAIGNEALIEAAQGILSQYDSEWGGFSKAPKFPPSMTLDFLLAVRSTKAAEGNRALAASIDKSVRHTLDAMAHGGIFDQVGGGFARYSVDQYWLIPHFEKMLYDNALLIDIYSKGWMRYRDPLYKAIVEETIGWLEREMKDPDGGFYASLDADSEGEEGKYYVWTPDELVEILGKEDAATFADIYSITEKGNFEHGTSNPALVYKAIDKRAAMAPLREKLLAVRETRIPPGKDTKRLLSWNAMLIRALAEAGFAFQKPEWIVLARETADWLWNNLRDENGRLYTVYYETGPEHVAYLDDYAHYIEALLAVASKIDAVEPGTAKSYIEKAEAVTAIVMEQFRDEREAGFYFVADDHEELIARKKDWFDNARPAGNSSMVHVLSALYALTGKEEYIKELGELKKGYPGIAERAPSAVAHALSGMTQDAMGIAVIKTKGEYSLSDLSTKLSEKPWRETYFIATDDEAQPEGFQLCVGVQCLPPETDSEAVVELL